MVTPSSSNPLTNLVHDVLSFDGNIMLAAIISLLLVILFVLLLHVYAKWFLTQAQYTDQRRRRRRRTSPSSIPGFLGSRFHFHTFTIETAPPSNSPTKGLESSDIASVPLFVYKKDGNVMGECVICLTVFEEEEVGRKLPKCGHAFHVDCIDMWLHSHSTCPICRAPVLVGDQLDSLSLVTNVEHGFISNEEDLEIVVEVPNSDMPNVENRGKNVVVELSADCSSSPIKKMMMIEITQSECKVVPSGSASGGV